MKNTIMALALCLCALSSSALFAADYEGRLDWSSRVEMSTLVSGVVDKVNVKPGQTVNKGDILLSLDERDFIYNVASSKAVFQRGKANYEEARREHERSKELYDRSSLSDHELQLKQIKLFEARAAMEMSESAMQIAQLDLERSVLRAPFDGVVVSVMVEAGASVLNRFQLRPLVTLASTGHMNAVSKVDSRIAANMKEGASASVGVRGDWLIGSVLETGREPVEISDKGTFYLLTVTFTPGELKLRAGEKVTIRIED